MSIRTNYDLIADAYDEDRKGREYGAHWLIKERLAAGERHLAALDVGCGPGRWLAAQCRHFRGHRIIWAGVEPFQRMLGLAWRNAPGAQILLGRAEALPFADRSFDLVMSVTSFHHFEDKEKALDQIVRVLRPGGAFEYANIEPWSMPGWWPYRFFPEAREADERWFWPPDRLMEALTSRGLSVTHNMYPDKGHPPIESLVAGALRRNASQFHAIDDAALDRGVARLRALLAENPKATYADEFAFMVVTARKPANG